MGIQILNKDVSVISNVMGKPKASISSIFGTTGWAGGGVPASQGPLVPAIAADLFNSTVSWNNITSIQNNTNNGTYAYAIITAAQQANTIYVRNFGFSIPTSATINGITVQINKSADDNITDADVYLVNNTGTAVGTNKAITAYFWAGTNTAPQTYGGSSDLWGTTWTPSIINSNNFGLHLAGYWGSYTKFSFLMYVSWVKITVNYTT
jgi:hypothetical protein